MIILMILLEISVMLNYFLMKIKRNNSLKINSCSLEKLESSNEQ